MPKLIIDLSAREGLAPRFYGDLPFDGTSTYNNSNYQLRKDGSKSQYAKGTCNPISKFGYLSPANNTFKGSTNGTAAVMSATLADSNNGYGFFFERSSVLHRTQSFTATSFGDDVNIPGTVVAGTDLEIYSVNGIRKIFFAYQTLTTGNIGVWDVTGLSGAGSSGSVGFLDYDTQTVNFTIGETVTGGTSGANGVVVGDKDNGTSGTLMIRSKTGGTFQSGENLTGSSTGVAKVAAGLFSSVKTDFMSTMPSGATTLGSNNIKMIVADNGLMYILDGSAIHRFDGTTAGGNQGTLTPNVILFPPFFQLTDGIDYRGKIWAALTRIDRDVEESSINTSVNSESCGVYVWDRKSDSSSFTDFIPVSGARETRFLFILGGIPHLFTISSTGYTQIRKYTGNEFSVVEELEPDAFPAYKDSVQQSGDMIVWAGYGGKIYAFGKAGTNPVDKLYRIGDVYPQVGTNKTFVKAGAILLMNGSESTSSGLNASPEAYYLSWSDSNPTYFFRKWYPHAYSPATTFQSPFAGPVHTLVNELPKLSKVISVTLRFPPVSIAASTEESMYLDLYFNNSTTSWGRTTLTRADAARGWKYIEVGKNNVNTIQAAITWATTETTFNSITPDYLEVVYEEETKKK